jgi:hypothetical protein
VVDEERAAVVRRILRLYVREGMGPLSITELLNAEGVPSLYASRGTRTKRWLEQERRWSTGTLCRPLPRGARAGKEIAAYETPRIVDDETIAAAPQLLGERFIEVTRNARRLYLLRGPIRCYCGRAVVGDGRQRPPQH